MNSFLVDAKLAAMVIVNVFKLLYNAPLCVLATENATETDISSA